MEHRILFTGHMIDAKGRNSPRFPARKETRVSEEIEGQLKKKKDTFGDEMIGMAGGACGGDIIFHELCYRLGIRTELYLALPIAEFRKESVSFAGEEWERRFDKLIALLPVHILPEPVSTIESDNVWERANLWILNTALENGGNNMTLIALWNMKGGDGNGGTEHMVKVAHDENAKVVIINIDDL